MFSQLQCNCSVVKFHRIQFVIIKFRPRAIGTPDFSLLLLLKYKRHNKQVKINNVFNFNYTFLISKACTCAN